MNCGTEVHCFNSDDGTERYLSIQLPKDTLIQRVVVQTGYYENNFVGKKLTAGNNPDSNLNEVIAVFSNFKAYTYYTFAVNPAMTVEYVGISGSGSTGRISVCEISIY